MTNDIKIEYTITYIDENEVPHVTGYIERIQKVNGDWQEIITHISLEDENDRIEVTTLGIGGEGSFKLDEDNEKLIYLGPRPEGYIPIIDEEEIENSSEFLEAYTFLGEDVYELENEYGENFIIAKNLDGVLLRAQKLSTQLLATNIDYGTFSINSLPNWTVDNSLFDELKDEEADENSAPNDCRTMNGCNFTVQSAFCGNSRICLCGYDYFKRCCIFYWGYCIGQSWRFTTQNLCTESCW